MGTNTAREGGLELVGKDKGEEMNLRGVEAQLLELPVAVREAGREKVVAGGEGSVVDLSSAHWLDVVPSSSNVPGSSPSSIFSVGGTILPVIPCAAILSSILSSSTSASAIA